MRGKDKCRILKQIRRQIADENEIPYVVEECQHKGECKGTCPKCEADLRMLERELSLRHRIGKTVAIAGIAAGTVTMSTGCDMEDAQMLLQQLIGVENSGGDIQGGWVAPDPYRLSGDIEYIPDRETDGESMPEPDPDSDTTLSGKVLTVPDQTMGFVIQSDADKPSFWRDEDRPFWDEID